MEPRDNQGILSTPAKSHICDESLIISTKRVSFAESMIFDKESATMDNVAPLSQSFHLNDNFPVLLPSFGLSTPGKSIPLRPNWYVSAESSIFAPPQEGGLETVTERVDMVDPIHDQESTTTGIETSSSTQCCDLSDKFSEILPSFGISTPEKPISVRLHSHVSAESSIFAPSQEGYLKTMTERMGILDPKYDQESTITGIKTGDDLNAKQTESTPMFFGISTPASKDKFAPSSEDLKIVTESMGMVDPKYDQESTTTGLETADDLNAKLTESTPISLGVSTPASTKGKKRKVNAQNCVGTPKKKRKVYWPKVKGQTKRKTTPKVALENKIESRNVSMVNGDKGEHKRISRSKSVKQSKESDSGIDECEFDTFFGETPLEVDKHEVQDEFLSTLKEHIISKKTPILAKGKSAKRSLKFELDENFEEPLRMQSDLDELGFKGDSLQILKKKITQKRINPSCSLLTRSRRTKLKIPTQKRYESQKKQRIQEHELPFQYIKKRKRSNNRRRKINFYGVTICNSFSLSQQRVEEEKERQGLKHQFECTIKGKRTMKKRRIEKATNFGVGIIPKQDFGKWEIREGSKAPSAMSNFVEYPLDEDDQGENEVKDERKGKIRRKKTKSNVKSISRKEVNVLIKKFQSLNITKEANYKNQDRRLVPYKGRKEGRQIKVKTSNTELVSYKNQEGQMVSYKGMKEGQRIKVKVNLDSETLNEWNLVMHGKLYDENENNKEYWRQERSIYLGRVNAFIARMHNFLGNRSFSSWKGSVLDSVIGVFLTQNVSDHLSSSAYMSLAAAFPIKTSSEERKDNLPLLKLENSSEASTTNESLNLGNKKLNSPGIVFGKKKSLSTKKRGDQTEQERKKEEEEAEEQDKQYWESLRRRFIQYCTPRSSDHADSIDWEAVRCANVNKVAKAIEGRGQHNMIAQRIQALLNKLVEMHGTTDLEWLRHAPPNEVKEYLLKVYGLGLKSVECIRLLALAQIAFPVDVNVGRIAVRLGWVPLEPLPGSIQFHLLDQYPIIDMVQQYLWPRLCTIDQPTLYQLHYHLITFGKVFCTKRRPNCRACPMRGECKHYASACASPTFALPENDAEERQNNGSARSEVPAKCLECFSDPLIVSNVSDTSTTNTKTCEPIVDYPASPSPENSQTEIEDIEDLCKSDDDSEEFIVIKLSEERLKACDNHFGLNDMESSNVVVAYNPNRASKFMPKMKSVNRLRTEHMVYVLPDTHPLLAKFPMREVDDPSNYLFVMWTPEELKESCKESQNQSSCSNINCFSCNNVKEGNNQTVQGTILVPCRTARYGRFPLNGTYFQVNEVFADAESSQHPILVPTKWLWNLPTRIAYFGTSTSTIFSGLSLEEIQECFWRGYVCVRASDRKTGAPKPLPNRFHRKTADQLILKKKRQRNHQHSRGKESGHELIMPMKE